MPGRGPLLPPHCARMPAPGWACSTALQHEPGQLRPGPPGPQRTDRPRPRTQPVRPDPRRPALHPPPYIRIYEHVLRPLAATDRPNALPELLAALDTLDRRVAEQMRPRRRLTPTPTTHGHTPAATLTFGNAQDRRQRPGAEGARAHNHDQQMDLLIDAPGVEGQRLQAVAVYVEWSDDCSHELTSLINSWDSPARQVGQRGELT